MIAQSSKKPIYDDDDGTPATESSYPAQPTAASESSTFTGGSSLFSAAPTQTQRTRGPTPTDRLAAQIRVARLFLHQQVSRAEDAVNTGMDKAFDLEQSFTGTVASLAPPRESGERLMPGLIYVLVAGMAGSIVSRNRNILLRAATPLAFGLGAAWVVIPVTMGNVSELTARYESRFPAVADAHKRTREGVESGWRFAKVHSDLAVRMVDEKVSDAREAVEGWVRKGK